MRRFVCVILALALCAALSVPALAYSSYDDSYDYEYGYDYAYDYDYDYDDYDYEDEDSYDTDDTGNTILGCLIAGVVIGLIVVLIMKGQMKTVHYQSGADSYTSGGSLQLTCSADTFLYQTVTRHARPQNNRK